MKLDSKRHQGFHIALLQRDGDVQSYLEDLSAHLSIPLVIDASGCDYYLVFDQQRLFIVHNSAARPAQFFVDFIGGKVGHRQRSKQGKGQALIKAIGMKSADSLSVVDVTAGLGRDAFVMATLGCKVDLVERSPIVATLLRDGLERAMHDPAIATIVDRMKLHTMPGQQFLNLITDNDKPDVIYMDPMYPERKKTALVKKEMRFLKDIVGNDEDAAELFETALHCAKKRIVVKRPAKADFINARKPDFQLHSKNTRYDVYRPI